MSKDLLDRLGVACNGTPALIPWPHRLLHDAADHIQELEVACRKTQLFFKTIHFNRDTHPEAAEALDAVNAALT